MLLEAQNRKKMTNFIAVCGRALRYLTSEFSLPQCAPTKNQEPIRPAVPVLTCAGDRPALFPLSYYSQRKMLQMFLDTMHMINNCFPP